MCEHFLVLKITKMVIVQTFGDVRKVVGITSLCLQKLGTDIN